MRQWLGSHGDSHESESLEPELESYLIFKGLPIRGLFLSPKACTVFSIVPEAGTECSK